VTSIPGCTKWFQSPSLESLSLENSTVLKGEKERIVDHGQKEIGVLVKCYSGIENSLKVCDLVEIIGILEWPDNQIEEEEKEVIIHAVTIRKKDLYEIVMDRFTLLSQGIFLVSLLI
jgi:hypothetical protein